MSYAAIGIGGSGARCLETLIYLCAAGLGPRSLHLIVVDPDANNGNTTATAQLIDLYNRCRQGLNNELGSAGIPLFKTELTIAVRDGDQVLHWSPTAGDTKLADMLRYNQHRAYQDLTRVFYSKDEVEMDWGLGFNARASVGAPVLAQVHDHLEEEPWKSLLSKAQADCAGGVKSRVFVFSSLFGGTGAAGFQTIPRVIRDAVFNNRDWIGPDLLEFGGGALLPYFGYEVKKDEGIRANPNMFLPNTQAALLHYSSVWESYERITVRGKSLPQNPFRAVYLVGKNPPDPWPDRGGGSEKQRNKCHFVELISCLGCLHFFFRDVPPTQDQALQYVIALDSSEAELNVLKWPDLPAGSDAMDITQLEDIRRRVSALHATVAFWSLFLKPVLAMDQLRARRLVPWLTDNFGRDELSNLGHDATHIEQFFGEYERWLLDLHRDSTEDEVRLFESGLINDVRRKEVRAINAVLADLRRNGDDSGSVNQLHVLDDVFSEMSRYKCPASVRSPLTKLLYLVYKSCERQVPVH